MNLNKSQFWVKLGLFGPQDKEFGSRWVRLVDLIWSHYNNYFTIKVPLFLMTDSRLYAPFTVEGNRGLVGGS
jgi:hypothetical protein